VRVYTCALSRPESLFQTIAFRVGAVWIGTATAGQDSTDMKYLLAAILILATSSAMAGTSAGYGMGGQFARFDPVVAEHNRTGELFRIEGHCQSACTLFLGIRNVCIEPSAQLLFHAGKDRSGSVSAKSTNRMLAAYKPVLRQYLVSNHYMDTAAFHAISGRELIDKFGYRACPK
jgi:hypothetical protein